MHMHKTPIQGLHSNIKGYTAILNLSAKIILSHEGCYRDAQYENHRNKSLYSKMIVQLCVTHKPA